MKTTKRHVVIMDYYNYHFKDNPIIKQTFDYIFVNDQELVSLFMNINVSIKEFISSGDINYNMTLKDVLGMRKWNQEHITKWTLTQTELDLIENNNDFDIFRKSLKTGIGIDLKVGNQLNVCKEYDLTFEKENIKEGIREMRIDQLVA